MNIRLTEEVIESLSRSFYAKYSGKGLSPSVVMELHKSEYWESIARAARKKLVEWLEHEVIIYHNKTRLVLPFDQWEKLKKELGIK